MNKELARDLVGAGVHFGHAVSRWNPKMESYIFGKRGMIHIINVKETLKGLLISKKLLANVVSSGKDVVFVGTKRQAQKAVQQAAVKCGMHFVTERWLGGTLTNYQTIRERIRRLVELEEMESSGKLEAESKKQGARLKRELAKVRANLDGVRRMNRLPGVVVVVDAKKEYIALREARKLGILTVAIIDTDSNPDTTDVAIPANDDSIKAVEILLNDMAEAIIEGKTMVKPDDLSSFGAGTRPVRTRSPRRRRTLATAEGQTATDGAEESDDDAAAGAVQAAPAENAAP